MFHRRKIILNLVDEFGKKIEKGRFYQLLFLESRMQKEPEFHFVPLGDSLISFLAENDVRVMKKYGYLAESDDVVLKSMPKEAALPDEAKAVLRSLRKESGKFPAKVLNDYIMKVFPPKGKTDAGGGAGEKFVYSLGYEGKDIDEYIFTLLQNGVTLLCDVRKNPLSMKFGFSKSQLKSFCESVNITYRHFPEFGIETEKRKGLENASDFKNLFDNYEKNILPKKAKEIQDLLDTVAGYERAAFTCYEADADMCHRSRLIKAAGVDAREL